MEVGLIAIGAGLAVGLAAIGTGYAQGHIGSAGAAALSSAVTVNFGATTGGVSSSAKPLLIAPVSMPS